MFNSTPAAFIAALMLVIGAPALADTPAKSTAGTISGELLQVDRGAAHIWLAWPRPGDKIELTVTDPTAKERLSQANIRDQTGNSSGDIVQTEVDDTANPTSATKNITVERPVSVANRLITLTIALAILALIAASVTRWRPWNFLIGVNNRYSNSQTQIVLWFGAVAVMYLTAVLVRLSALGFDYIGGVDLPANLIALTGLSALTFGGAKVITVQKIDTAKKAGLATPKANPGTPNILTDLVTNDSGQADFGDFQMILITLAAVAIFVLSAFHFLGLLAVEHTVTLPDVDTTLLSGFGLGQGAYLIKKAALKPGEG